MLTWATFWISDFEEGGAAELGGGAGIHGLEPLGKWLQGFSVGQTTSAMQADDSVAVVAPKDKRVDRAQSSRFG